MITLYYHGLYREFQFKIQFLHPEFHYCFEKIILNYILYMFSFADIERRSMTPSVCSLWKQLDSIVTNLKDQTSSKQKLILQRSRTRRQVCNKRIGLPAENCNEQKQNQRTRRSLNLNSAPELVNCLGRVSSELLESSDDEQETNVSSSCISRVTLNKTGRQIIVKNSTPSSPKVVQKRNVVEDTSPIKTLPALFDDCENSSRRYNTRSSKVRDSPPVKNSNQKYMCNNRKSISRTPKGKKSFVKINNLCEKSSHKDEAFSEPERDVEYESDHVSMETDFHTPQDHSPMLKICDHGDDAFKMSSRDVSPKHFTLDESGNSNNTRVCVCENKVHSESCSQIQGKNSQTSELHRDIHKPLAKTCDGDNSAIANLDIQNTVSSTSSASATIKTTEIVGTVVCQTTTLNSSDSGFAPSISSEPRCAEEIELQNTSSGKFILNVNHCYPDHPRETIN